MMDEETQTPAEGTEGTEETTQEGGDAATE